MIPVLIWLMKIGLIVGVAGIMRALLIWRHIQKWGG